MEQNITVQPELVQVVDNDIKVFNSPQFGTMRAVGDNENPLFVAKDVCDILGITNVTAAVQRLDEDERSKFNLGRQGETNVINEFGLYSLVLASRKPEAKQFKRWVTHDVSHLSARLAVTSPQRPRCPTMR